VDVAARIRYFVPRRQNELARLFLIRYQDRVLYATDFTLAPGDDAGGAEKSREAHERDWSFSQGRTC